MRNFKISSILCLALAMAGTSCSNSNEPENASKSKSDFTFLANSSYKALFDNNQEVFGRYWYTDMHLFQDQPDDNHYAQHDDPRNFYLNNSKRSFTICDSCNYQNDGKNTEFQITRTIKLSKGKSIALPYSSSRANLDPIRFIRPYSTQCDPTPLCYYKDMEIEWNADANNKNGVVIIVEWQGSTISNSKNIHIVTGDVVPDKGVTVLRNELFDDIPDEALVNLWLMRANMGKAKDQSTPELQQKLNEMIKESDFSDKEVTDILSIIQNESSPIVANGSVALLPIILIRNL